MTYELAKWPEKDPAEIKAVTIDFAADVGYAASIVDAVVTCVIASGGVNDDPAQMLDGAPQITGMANTSPKQVTQRIRGGVDGSTYVVQCLATDSDGLKHLVARLLPVRRYALKAKA